METPPWIISSLFMGWMGLLFVGNVLLDVFGKRLWQSKTWRRRLEWIDCLSVVVPTHLGYVYLTIRLWWDRNHPREWDGEFNDPRFYGPVVAIGWFVIAVVWLGVLWKVAPGWRKARRTKWLLTRVEKLIREKRFDEAESCLNEAKVLTNYKEPSHL